MPINPAALRRRQRSHSLCKDCRPHLFNHKANRRRQRALYFIIVVKICDQLAGATFKLIINLVQDKSPFKRVSPSRFVPLLWQHHTEQFLLNCL